MPDPGGARRRGPTSLSCPRIPGTRLERSLGIAARLPARLGACAGSSRQPARKASSYRPPLPLVVSERQLFSASSGTTSTVRTTWGGMLDTPSSTQFPNFANGPSAHILYPNRPRVWEMVLAVVPALLFVTAATRARRRAARHADDLRHLRTRFPPAPDSSRVAFVDLDGVVRASRVAVVAVLLAIVPTICASVPSGSAPRAAPFPGRHLVAGGGEIAIASRDRLSWMIACDCRPAARVGSGRSLSPLPLRGGSCPLSRPCRCCSLRISMRARRILLARRVRW